MRPLSTEDAYLNEIESKPGVVNIAGVLCETIKSGKGDSPRLNSVVMVYYKGSLTNGKLFDDNTRQPYPDAFRLKELIVGWQIALPKMKVGDKWRIHVPSRLGYGKRAMKGIPKNSTLIFEIELVGIA